LTDWMPLSARNGNRPDNHGPFEGVPDHLRPVLTTWFSTVIGRSSQGPSATEAEAGRERVRRISLRFELVTTSLGDYARLAASDPELFVP
jgi:hypothetical protein